METKSIFKSKTVWFNVIAATFGILAGVDVGQLDAFGIPHEWQSRILAIIGFVATVGNIYLRAITSMPITGIETKKE